MQFEVPPIHRLNRQTSNCAQKRTFSQTQEGNAPKKYTYTQQSIIMNNRWYEKFAFYFKTRLLFPSFLSYSLNTTKKCIERKANAVDFWLIDFLYRIVSLIGKTLLYKTSKLEQNSIYFGLPTKKELGEHFFPFYHKNYVQKSPKRGDKSLHLFLSS